MTKRKRYTVTLHLPERYTYKYTELVAALFPQNLYKMSKRQYINVSLVELWNHLYPGEMPLSLGILVKELQSRLEASQSEIITAAIAFHAGKDSR